MKKASVIISLFFGCIINMHAQKAAEIVKKADDKMKGEQSGYSEMTMTIVRPDWERNISFKTWSKGNNLSLALVTAPAKEKGQAYLRRNREMWSWNPTINRIFKLPPSMLSQGWMGSDFTNDDLLNESSIVTDYYHSLLGTETVNGHECHKIESIPKENAPVVWGKVMLWISKNEYLQMKAAYYDEDNYLVKSEKAYNVQSMDGRLIPTRFELIPADEEGHKTVIEIDEITFNKPISDSFFTQQNMKKVR
ncbi:MAG: outer membrane lipoprotein-sorting protein [Bacteroidetes bacterium]|jgi:outer membrane lipoprotein-sorting protein|nr:outer membrane lipoprotein-sorting protein [Bacteroidota bacterium]